MNEAALVAALALVARQLTTLPAAIVRANREAARAREAGTVTPPPPADYTRYGPGNPYAMRVNPEAVARDTASGQVRRVMVVGGEGGPIPVQVVGGKADADKLREGRPVAPTRRPDSAAAAIGGVAAMIGTKFAALLGPLYAISTVLQSTGSGFQLVNTAIKVFAATIAPLLLPVFVLMAGAIVAVSDKLWRELLPRLGEWYTLVMEKGIPAVAKLIEMFMAAVEAVKEFGEALKRWGQRFGLIKSTPGEDSKNDRKLIEDSADLAKRLPIVGGLMYFGRQFLSGGGPGEGGGRGGAAGETGEKVFTSLRATAPAAGGRIGEAARGATDRMAGELEKAADAGPFTGLFNRLVNQAGGQPGKGPTPSGPGGFMGDALKGMREVLQELRHSIGPRGSFSGLREYAKSAQLAAINMSPLDAKIMERMLHSIGLLEQKLAEIARNTQTKPEGRY